MLGRLIGTMVSPCAIWSSRSADQCRASRTWHAIQKTGRRTWTSVIYSNHHRTEYFHFFSENIQRIEELTKCGADPFSYPEGSNVVWSIFISHSIGKGGSQWAACVTCRKLKPIAAALSWKNKNKADQVKRKVVQTSKIRLKRWTKSLKKPEGSRENLKKKIFDE